MFPAIRNNHSLLSTSVAPVNRMDNWFDSFFGGDGGFAGRVWSEMPMAMWEDDDSIFIEADLPGVAEGDVDVTVHNGVLFVRAERRPEEGRRYLYNGRSFGRFERAVTLPGLVKTEDVHAALSNGVLRITLPKSPEAKPRKITLKTD